MLTNIQTIQLGDIDLVPVDLLTIEDESSSFSTLASMESTYHQLSDMCDRGEPLTKFGFAMVRKTINSGNDIQLSTESDNYFEYSDVRASMEGVLATIWKFIKEVFKKLCEAVKGIYQWIKRIYYKAKDKQKHLFKVQQALKNAKLVPTDEQYEIPLTSLATSAGGDLSVSNITDSVKAHTNFLSSITNNSIMDVLTNGVNGIAKGLNISTKQIKEMANAVHESGIINTANIASAFSIAKTAVGTMSVGQITNVLSTGTKAIVDSINSPATGVNESSAKEAVEGVAFAIEALYVSSVMKSPELLGRIKTVKTSDGIPHLDIIDGKVTNCINSDSNVEEIPNLSNSITALYSFVVKYYDDWQKRDQLQKSLEEVISNRFDINNENVNALVTSKFVTILRTYIQSELKVIQHADKMVTESFDLIKQLTKYHTSR